MLRLIGSHYHFRRAIPQDLKALLRRSEISLSLRTDKKLIARERAADLYARTGDFFHKARLWTNRLLLPFCKNFWPCKPR